MEYLSSMPFSNKVYFSQNDLKVFGLLNQKIIKTMIERKKFNNFVYPTYVSIPIFKILKPAISHTIEAINNKLCFFTFIINLHN